LRYEVLGWRHHLKPRLADDAPGVSGLTLAQVCAIMRELSSGRHRVEGSPTVRNQTSIQHETVGGEPYEYYPLGKHVVCARGVCGGRPTFKYTRIDVRHAMALLASGQTVDEVAAAYELPLGAVKEALALAGQAFEKLAKARAKAG
jgi:uncharacterized protein (DUF433 family)